jgi:hypothetical protein
MARLSTHSSNSPWFDKVTRITIENFETIKEAREAGKRVIKAENPYFNKTHAERSKLHRESLLTMSDLAFYLSIARGRINVDLMKNRFPIPFEQSRPYRWVKWKVDVHMLKPEVKQHIEKMKV